MSIAPTIQDSVFVVGIAGGSGAGKTWLASSLRRELGGQATHLALDDFYRDRSNLPESRRKTVNFDTPAAIDWKALWTALKVCQSGESLLRVPQYDFATHTRREEQTVLPVKPVVIVDGLWLFHRARLRTLIHLKIFVECPGDLRFCRRMERDVLERGRTADAVTKQFKTTVLPMHERHVQPQARWADQVLCSPVTGDDVLRLAERVKTEAAKKNAKISLQCPEQLKLKSYECLAD